MTLLKALAVLLMSMSFSLAPAMAKIIPPADVVRQILNRPEAQLDYLQAALAFDHLIDPASRAVPAAAYVDRLVDAARQMAGPSPTDTYKLAAIRRAVYTAGAWNYGRSFSYDLSDPLGQQLEHKLLSNYIVSRRGNCVSMPMLFVILAERLGLRVHLSTAPLHIFVRYINGADAAINLEATSGGFPASDQWYHRNFKITERALGKGIFMRTLTKREGIALMATTVVDFLIERHRYAAAIAVADEILGVNPREAYTMAKRGSAFGEMLRNEFLQRYPTPAEIPLASRARYQMLAFENRKAFQKAEALGWTPEQ